MNYITLKLNEKEWGAKLGLGYLRYLDAEAGIKIEEIDDLMKGAKSLIGVPKLIYYSIKYNCKKSKVTFNFTEEDVFDWIDDDGGLASPSIVDFINAFTASLTVDLGKKTPQKKEVAKV